MLSFEIETYGNVTSSQVRAELEMVTGDLFRNAAPDLTFIVALDFEKAVKRFVPYETGVEYTARRHYYVVLGKTIPILEDGRLRFVIILDAKVFEDMNPTTMVGRWEIIVHELFHVKINLIRFRATGTLPIFNPPQSKIEVARYNGEVFYEEYSVERTIANWLMDVARTYNITIPWTSTIGFANDVLRDLSSYESVLYQGVQDFETQKTDLEKVTRTITDTIANLLLLLAKIYAVAEVSDVVRAKTMEIEANATFVKYFVECWNRILSNLREYYENRTTYRFDLIDNIAKDYNDILHRSGMDFEDNPSGGYFVRMWKV